MNLRVVGIPTENGPINLRVIDLNSDTDVMNHNDRVLGPDGNPLALADYLYDLVFVNGDQRVVYETFADRETADLAALRLSTSGSSVVVLPHGTAELTS